MTVIEAIVSLPDFCWQTLVEVCGYVEQLTDQGCYSYVSRTLADLERKGIIESKAAKRDVRTGGILNIKMYRRRSA